MALQTLLPTGVMSVTDLSAARAAQAGPPFFRLLTRATTVPSEAAPSPLAPASGRPEKTGSVRHCHLRAGFCPLALVHCCPPSHRRGTEQKPSQSPSSRPRPGRNALCSETSVAGFRRNNLPRGLCCGGRRHPASSSAGCAGMPAVSESVPGRVGENAPCKWGNVL